MNKYQSYKPSGVEWIGEIPEFWVTKKMKYLVQICNGSEFKDFTLEEGGYPVFGSGGEFSRSSKFIYDKISVLLGRKGSVDKPKIVKEPFWCSDTTYYTKIKDGVNPYFFFFLVQQINFKRFIYGSTIPSMTKSVYDEMVFPYPSINEQNQIVQFLDEKTELIDKLISTKERKVTLLKEQRISLINQVVTKGLNPDVKMKDSGVEWIGDIPEGWKVGRLGYFSNVFRGSGYQYLNQVDENFEGRKERVVRISDISEFNPIWFEYLEQFENYRIKKDEILMGGTGHYFGKSIYVTDEMEGLIHSYNIIRIVVKNLNTKYIQYYISSHMIREQMDMSVLGSGQPFIDLQGLKDLIILIPENNEQLQIVEHLDSKTKEIDDLVYLEQKKIDLLKEYRQSLISEVVTGKIKVTN